MDQDAQAPRVASWTPWVVGVAASLAVLLLPEIQDYADYGRQWAAIPHGGNPWFGAHGQWNGNAYGPLHTLLAWPYLLSPKLPRLLTVVAWAATGGWLFRRPGPWPSVLYWAAPFLWSEVVVFSHNDVLVAVLCLAALVLAERGRPVGSGVLLAMAITIKLYPLALVPFFAVRARRLCRRWLAACALAVLAIYGLAYLAWGGSVWQSLIVATGRPSDCHSIFYLLRVGGLDVDRASLPLMALSGGLLWAVYVRQRWPLAPGVTLAICLVMLFYKVGHWQFQAFLYLAVLYLWAGRASLPAGVRRAALVYTAWMSVSAVAYLLFDRYDGRFWPLRWIGCIPATAALVWLLVGLAADQLAPIVGAAPGRVSVRRVVSAATASRA